MMVPMTNSSHFFFTTANMALVESSVARYKLLVVSFIYPKDFYCIIISHNLGKSQYLKLWNLPINFLYDNLLAMAKTVIEVNKNSNENNASVLRRFSRRIQESNIIQKVKSSRYNKRKESKLKVKKSTLKHLERRKEMEKLRKLGKIK